MDDKCPLVSFSDPTSLIQTHPLQGFQKKDCGPEMVSSETRKAASHSDPGWQPCEQTSEDASRCAPGMEPLPSSPGTQKSEHTQAQGFQWEGGEGCDMEGQSQDVPMGMCPPHPASPPKLRAQQAFPLQTEVSPSSLSSRCCPQETTRAEAGDAEQVSTTVLPLGEPLLTWLGPLLSGPPAVWPRSSLVPLLWAMQGSERWGVGGRGGEATCQSLCQHPVPTPLPTHLAMLWVPVPTVRADSPQSLLRKADAFRK